MMMGDTPTSGVPWLSQPVMLHGSRAYECTLNSTRMCEYQQGYWRFWYEADHRFALPTVALFTSTIVLFSLFSIVTWWIGPRKTASPLVQRVQAAKRFLSYRTFRIARLDWNTAPVGVLFLGAVGVIYFFSMSLGPRPYYWPSPSLGGSPPLATRTGWMSLGCLPFVLATSAKSNLVTAATGISHERLQVFHRWISYAMYVLALIHTFPFIIHEISLGDMVEQWNTRVGYWTGVVAILAQTWLVFASFSPFRNMHYELFKFTHFLAALVFVVFFFLHCDFTLTSSDYFIVAGAIYASTWLHSQIRMYFTHGVRLHARLELTGAADDAATVLRIRIPARGTRWRAGQHFFLRFPTGLGLGTAWSSHPFTACSLPARAAFFDAADAELVFYVRPRGGLTARLMRKAVEAEATAGTSARVRVLLDGPYGGVEMRRLVEPARLLVVVGGSGAGFALPLVESFLRRRTVEAGVAEDEALRAASMRIVLATREGGTGRWFEEAVRELVQRYEFLDVGSLEVEIYCTAAAPRTGVDYGQVKMMVEDVEKGVVVDASLAASDDSDSDVKGTPSVASTSRFASRPDISAIISTEARMNESTAVFVCGPLSMQHDAANAVAREQVRSIKDGAGDIYLHTEHFSWA